MVKNKILVDQNISFRVVRILDDLYPGMTHIKDLGLVDAGDNEIYEFAAENGFDILTFDGDFCDMNVTKGFKIKIIHLRLQNQTTKNIVKFLRDKHDDIKNFLSGNENSCLNIQEKHL